MPATPPHRVLAADQHRVPPPFQRYAVRSEEPCHAGDARAPYGRVHLLQTRFIDAASMATLCAVGRAGVRLDAALDVDYAATTWPALAAAAPGVHDLPGHIAAALQVTGVLGTEPAAYAEAVTTRVDYLAARGAGFHNDVARHWSRCLFWVLALDLHDVEFVMPHAGVRVALQPGDLVVFDPALAHGLCRPVDAAQALAASFEAGPHAQQLFLTGELLLSDSRWAALGAPWLPLQHAEHTGALDLLAATFDERSGAIQRVHTLRGRMRAADR